jgi:hypothetical protein
MFDDKMELLEMDIIKSVMIPKELLQQNNDSCMVTIGRSELDRLWYNKFINMINNIGRRNYNV